MTTMIDHLSTYATNYEATKDFYRQVFSPLGYELALEFALSEEEDEAFPGRRICSFGSNGQTTFWIIESREKSTPRHIAFSASTRDAVDAFHRTALDSGAKCNGEPGPRTHYHEHYYGAFVFDPDGNDIEAVCHTAP